MTMSFYNQIKKREFIELILNWVMGRGVFVEDFEHHARAEAETDYEKIAGLARMVAGSGFVVFLIFFLLFLGHAVEQGGLGFDNL